MDLHLNTCPLCNTANPSPPKQPPPTCSGCGRKLELFRLDPAEAKWWGYVDGQSDDRWQRRRAKR